MLVATALTLAVIGFVTSMLIALVRQDGPKIVAALQGRAWVGQSPVPAGPVAIRFSPRCTAARPEPARPVLRAAA